MIPQRPATLIQNAMSNAPYFDIDVAAFWTDPYPDQLALVCAGRAKWLDGVEGYSRRVAPIGMSPRHVAKHWSYGGVDFEPEDRVFFMFGSANRDEACFADRAAQSAG